MISFRERKPIPIGIATLVGLFAGLVLTFNLGNIPFIARNHPLSAEFADAAGLSPENEVRAAGVKIGKVTSVELMQDRVLVGMLVDDGVEIPRSAKAKISLKTILGTKFVSIDATGTRPYFEPGDTIPLSQTSIPFEIYQAANKGVELLQEIDAAALNESFKSLAESTRDPDRNLARALESGAEVAAALASETDSIKSVITKGEELLSALDANSGEVQSLISNSDDLLRILNKRRNTVKSLLRNTERLLGSLGGLLKEKRPEIDSILNDLHSALIIVDRNLVEVEEALRLAGPSSESLGRVLWRGRWASICISALRFYFGGVPLPVGEPPSDPVDCAT